MTQYDSFTNDQIASFNAFQVSGAFHPFTCPRDHHGGVCGCQVDLVAHQDGLHCLYEDCDYRQNLCHPWMLDWSWQEMQAKIWGQKKEEK